MAGRKSLGHRPRHAAPQHVVEAHARLEIIAVRRAALGMEDRAGLGHALRADGTSPGWRNSVGSVSALKIICADDHRAVAAGVVGRGALPGIAAEIDDEAFGGIEIAARQIAPSSCCSSISKSPRGRARKPARARRSPSSNRLGKRGVEGVVTVGLDELPDARVAPYGAAAICAQRSPVDEIRQARVLATMMSNTEAIGVAALEQFDGRKPQPLLKNLD